LLFFCPITLSQFNCCKTFENSASRHWNVKGSCQ
jgi:hypothetical protein